MTNSIDCTYVQGTIAEQGLESALSHPAVLAHTAGCESCSELVASFRDLEQFEQLELNPSEKLEKTILERVQITRTIRNRLPNFWTSGSKLHATVIISAFLDNLPLLIGILLLATSIVGGISLGQALTSSLGLLLLWILLASILLSVFIKHTKSTVAFTTALVALIFSRQILTSSKFELPTSKFQSNAPVVPSRSIQEKAQHYKEFSIEGATIAQDYSARNGASTPKVYNLAKSKDSVPNDERQVGAYQDDAAESAEQNLESDEPAVNAPQEVEAGKSEGFGNRRKRSKIPAAPQAQGIGGALLDLSSSASSAITAAKELPQLYGKPDQNNDLNVNEIGEELAGLTNGGASNVKSIVQSGRKSSDAEKLVLPKLRSNEEVLARVNSDKKAVHLEKLHLKDSEVREIADDDRGLSKNLKFQPASGYWRNTYIPGDPRYVLLAKRLSENPSSKTNATLRGGRPIEELANQYTQPFDPPLQSALSLFVSSDQTSIAGETRALVQVGIKASERLRGSRPAMNIAIVLDLTNNATTSQNSEIIGRILSTFEKERQIGDTFTLIVAGNSGGIAIPAAEFRYGTVAVFNKAIQENKLTGTPTSLTQALAQAIKIARRSDSPSAPLGTSSILYVTPNEPNSDLSMLRKLAHDSATSGVPLSVLSIGTNSAVGDFDSLVLAGQGNRRVASTSEQAESAIKRELEALTRVVARALRVRIKLGTKVKLVRVLGSERLDTRTAQMQREMENSIDQRLSRSLGIQADRGEDEDGIQIIIPAFYAGDSHVILLDVVVEGPGSVADAQLRYKDLIYLKNATTRAVLELTNSSSKVFGSRELNVLKNYLGYRLHEGLLEAAQALSHGNKSNAQVALSRLTSLMEKYSASHFRDDEEIRVDKLMLSQLSSTLSSSEPIDKNYLNDALNYAAERKILAKPAE